MSSFDNVTVHVRVHFDLKVVYCVRGDTRVKRRVFLEQDRPFV